MTKASPFLDWIEPIFMWMAEVNGCQRSVQPRELDKGIGLVRRRRQTYLYKPWIMRNLGHVRNCKMGDYGLRLSFLIQQSQMVPSPKTRIRYQDHLATG
jgi:hypothetical protein